MSPMLTNEPFLYLRGRALGRAGPAVLSDGPSVTALDRILGTGGDYAFFDTKRLDNQFQTSTGGALADDAGESVGLLLSSERWGSKSLAEVMAGQPELVPTGNWTPLSDAILTNQSQSGFRLQSGAADAIVMAQKTWNGFVVGRPYRVRCSITAGVYDTAFLRVGTSTITGTGSLIDASTSLSSREFEFLFVATATTLFFGIALSRSAFSADATVSGFSIAEAPAHYGFNASGTQQPKRQAAGLTGDGSDDNLLSDWLAQSGANCIIAKVAVPASIPSTQMVAGAAGASSTGRYRLEFGTSGGFQAVGGDTLVAASVGVDHRGQTAVVAASIDGAGNITAYSTLGAAATQPIVGGPTTTVPLRILAWNSNGSPFGSFGGSVDKLAFGKVHLTQSDFNAIAAEWAAA